MVGTSKLLGLSLGFATALLQAGLNAADWPMLGRDQTRNAVSPEKNAPLDWHVGQFDDTTQKWRPETARNIKWAAGLGTATFSAPVVSGGLVWIGTNNGNYDQSASVLKCFREADGKLLYEYVSPSLPERINDNGWGGIGCSPLVAGDRVWFTTNRCETVCLDIAPLKRGEGKPRLVWKVDMIKDLGVFPRAMFMGPARTCSIAAYGDYIYVVTGNGNGPEYHSLAAAPEAPSLVCFDKDSGKVVWKDNSPGKDILSGQWSSPLVMEIAGAAQVIAPQGDGWLRSFDALTGKLLWKFDMNLKLSEWKLGGRGNRNTLLATPVFYENRIYLATGNGLEEGDGPGRLCCIDPTKRGDISSELAVGAAGKPLPHRRVQAVNDNVGEKAIANPNSGLIWEFTTRGKEFEDQMHRTVANVVVHNGLVIAVDYSGFVHCLDAKSGKKHWTYDALSMIVASPLIVDDKVYVANEDGDVAILRLSADPNVAMRRVKGENKPLAEINTGGSSIYSSPVFANGVLYVATRNRLFAIAAKPTEVPTSAGHWPGWRGPNRDNISTETGLLKRWPDGGPPLVWKVQGIGQGIASVAVAKGRVYTLGYRDKAEIVTALDIRSGQRAWAAPMGPEVPENPLMRWLGQRAPLVDEDRLYAFRSEGELVCLATADGKARWRKSYLDAFGTSKHPWGLCDHPLVDGEKLICSPGGAKASIAALNKRSGEVIWQSKVEGARTDYAGVVAADVAGVRQYITFLGKSLIAVSAGDGKLLWRYEKFAQPYNATPIVRNDLLFCPGRRGGGLSLLKLAADRSGISAEEVYRKSLTLDGFQDATTWVGDHAYVFSSVGVPTCIEVKTGEIVWQKRQEGSRGQAPAWVYADGHLYMRHPNGRMALVEASPKGYVEKGAFVLPGDHKSMGATAPVVAGGRLFVRIDDALLCYDVTEGALDRTPTPKTIVLSPIASGAPAGKVERSGKERDVRPRSVFVPTPHDVAEKMLELAGVKRTDVVYDLGSGDGRILVAAAKQCGCKAVGFEIEPELVELSRERAKKEGVERLVSIEQKDIFTVDLREADVVTLYLLPEQLKRLLPQLKSLKPGSRIVSHHFELPGLKPEKVITVESKEDGGKHALYLWTAPLTTILREKK
jgi:outer membrane protein assembly factor BamB